MESTALVVLSKGHFVFDLLHYLQHFLFFPGVGHHLDPHWQSLGPFHRLRNGREDFVLVEVLEVLLIVSDSRDGHGSGCVEENAPNHGKSRAIAKFLA
jgi:hypothetical protein